MSPSELREMIHKDNNGLSLMRQCKLLKISHSLIYYTAAGFDQVTIVLMHEIDRIFTKHPQHKIWPYLLRRPAIPEARGRRFARNQ